jgi:hypothetical protein
MSSFELFDEPMFEKRSKWLLKKPSIFDFYRFNLFQNFQILFIYYLNQLSDYLINSITVLELSYSTFLKAQEAAEEKM